LGSYVAQLTTGVQARLQQATNLQSSANRTYQAPRATQAPITGSVRTPTPR
jgi:hypothetical protein